MLVGENLGKFGRSVANCQVLFQHEYFIICILFRDHSSSFLLQKIQTAELVTVFRYMVAMLVTRRQSIMQYMFCSMHMYH